MELPSKLLGIVGYPLGHSMSPALHTWGFEKVGFPGIYMAWSEPEKKLGAFFKAVRTLGIAGGNITIPHKVAAMEHMDHISDRAREIGAINTYYWEGEALCGENTDVIGFMEPLRGRQFAHALILGAGGVARAVVAGLKELGVPDITITNRTPAKATDLANAFGIHSIPWDERMQPQADLIVNATSQGMKGEQVDMTPYDAAALAGRTGLVYDIVYNPLETRLIREARAAGWQVESGLSMFVEQARAGFRLWTGMEMPREAAVEKVKKLLGL
ncbi:shikimate dehydrogenase [uncultured Desulfovibrio sp.]|uniref:shikimate dehydrogenase n=1 Tax=uncultured Desulfovibrio sp. TaxID=167968 RepID=UPI002804231F|nr:shikimate dehydrogenase [uncultured Desulfovibrio sp.]